MEEDKIRQLIEGIDPEGKIPEEKINEFISVIKDQEKNPLKDGDKIGDYTINFLKSNLKKELEVETDWRKRASIAAKIISNNLE